MRKFLVSALITYSVPAIVLLVSCSTPKYTYYFDRYSSGEIKTSPLIVTSKANQESLTASNGKPVGIDPVLKTLEVEGNLKPKTTRKQLVNGTMEPENIKKEFHKAAKEPDKKKNGFAYAGFVLAFSPLLAFLPFPGVAVGGCLLLIGLVFCIIGLRSEKKGFAITGLIIGLLAAAGFIIAEAIELSKI